MPVAMMLVPVIVSIFVIVGMSLVIVLMVVAVGVFMGHAAVCPTPSGTFHPFDERAIPFEDHPFDG